MNTVAKYLKTLRRIPDPVILSMATREFDMGYYRTCLCGWAIRESLAWTGKKPRGWYGPIDCAEHFGGSIAEWSDIFYGYRCADFPATGLPAIERAFVRRVAEAVR